MGVARFEVREVVIAIAAFCAAFMIADYFLVVDAVQSFASGLKNISILVSAFTAILGVVSLVVYHGRRISRRTEGQWPFSLWLLVILSIVTLFGIFGGTTNPQFKWFNTYWMIPINGASYALTFFYVNSAAFRAFKVKNTETVFLLISATLVALSRAPIGAVINKTLFPATGTWIMSVIAGAVQRAIVIGIAVGTIALGVRTMLGRERGFLIVEEGGEG